MFGDRYGSRPKTPGRRWSGTDKRYSTSRWQKVRKRVLTRDGQRCWVSGCSALGNVADHIDPVNAGTTDVEFFDERRLRASCRPHNLGRAYAPELDQLARGSTATASATPRPTRSTQPAPPMLTRDYTRRPL